MARKPDNLSWVGFSPNVQELLDTVDFLGNNGWSRTAQTEAMMPSLLERLAAEGIAIDRITRAMASIGYEPRSLHMLERWESKRTTGKFGR